MAQVCFDVVCALESSHKYEQIKKVEEGIPDSVLQCPAYAKKKSPKYAAAPFSVHFYSVQFIFSRTFHSRYQGSVFLTCLFLHKVTIRP